MGFTISVPRMDDALRRVSYAECVLQRALARRKPERDDSDTDIRWGVAGDFEGSNRPRIVSPIPPDPDEDEPTVIIEYDEYSRDTEDVRVENPDDASQYVIVERVTRIIFTRREDGVFAAFNFRYDD